jgi:hypothetical protein
MTPETVGVTTPEAREQAGTTAGEAKRVQRRAPNSKGEGPLQHFRQLFPGLFRF